MVQYTQARGKQGSPKNKVATPDQVIAMVMEEAKRRGLEWFQPYHAAGMVGNFMQESGNFRQDVINLQYRGDNGTAYGLMQWRHQRYHNLLDYSRQINLDPRDLKAQISFAFEEMMPNSKYLDGNSKASAGATLALRQLRQAGNAQQAAVAFIHAERPQGYNIKNPGAGHGAPSRIQFASQALQNFGNGENAGDYKSQEFDTQYKPSSRGKSFETGKPGELYGSVNGKYNGDYTNYNNQNNKALDSISAPMSKMLVSRLKNQGFKIADFENQNFGTEFSSPDTNFQNDFDMYGLDNSQYSSSYENQLPYDTTMKNIIYPSQTSSNNLTFGINYDNIDYPQSNNKLTFGF